MKYITTQINLRNSKVVLEPVYVPECSFGEQVFLRVVSGNFKPKKITAIFDGNSIGNRKVMVEKYPTVYECSITDNDVLNISKDTEMVFNVLLYIETDNGTYEINSPDIVKVLGMSLGPNHKTDLSLIYEQLNNIKDRLDV